MANHETQHSEGRYSQLFDCVLRDERLTSSEKLAYTWLRSFSRDRTETVSKGHKEIARALGCSTSYAKACAQKLITLGYIEVEREPGERNVYRFPQLTSVKADPSSQLIAGLLAR